MNFNVFRIHPQDDGSIRREYSGRFFESAHEVRVIEDLFGDLSGVQDGPKTKGTERCLSSLRRASYWSVEEMKENQ